MEQSKIIDTLETYHCASKSILLTTPEGKRIKYVSRHAPRRTQVNSLLWVVQEEVHVVKDYPDVFPEELPGMPPDWDIEFLIELLPGTGPISKRPHRMPANDLEEIKKHIKELLDKGYIRPSSIPSALSWEEGWIFENGCWLSSIEWGDDQE